MKPWLLALLLCAAQAAQAQAPINGFCVINLDDRPALFVVDAGDRGRKTALLAPSERLCTPEFASPAHGFVSVFYDDFALEGCSRLTRAGAVQGLLKYADFDNCAWQISR